MRGGRQLRTAVRRMHDRLARSRLRLLSRAELAQSTTIFAPHPDDETLACGGTIVLKRRAGAAVRIVFMTDGSGSHLGLVPRDVMARTRADEARRAVRALGVEPEDTARLALEDGSLAAGEREAVARVAEELARTRPCDVFVPCAEEPNPDHAATRAIVLQALRTRGQPATVYEYPVWMWNQWPWTSGSAWDRRHPLRAMKRSSVAAWRMLTELRWAVPIGEVLAVKRAALAHYRTQVERLAPSWPVLQEVAGGELLGCFFGEHERFRRYRFA